MIVVSALVGGGLAPAACELCDGATVEGGGGISSGDGDGPWFGEALESGGEWGDGDGSTHELCGGAAAEGGGGIDFGEFSGESGDGVGPTGVALRGTQIASAGLSKMKEKREIGRRILMSLFSIACHFSFAPFI